MADTNISETVPGGAYQLADGSWVNAQGKKINPPAFAQTKAKAVTPVTDATGTESAAEKRKRLKAEAKAKEAESGTEPTEE